MFFQPICKVTFYRNCPKFNTGNIFPLSCCDEVVTYTLATTLRYPDHYPGFCLELCLLEQEQKPVQYTKFLNYRIIVQMSWDSEFELVQDNNLSLNRKDFVLSGILQKRAPFVLGVSLRA